jgi:hypothetical protein
MFVPADAVSILSPDTVREFVIPRLRRITEHLDYCIAHTHSSYLHAIDPVLAIPGFQCVQVGLDTDGPPLEEVLPVMRKIQESRSLIVAVCQADVGRAVEQTKAAISQLSCDGLCVFAYLETAAQGREFLESMH